MYIARIGLGRSSGHSCEGEEGRRGGGEAGEVRDFCEGSENREVGGVGAIRSEMLAASSLTMASSVCNSSCEVVAANASFARFARNFVFLPAKLELSLRDNPGSRPNTDRNCCATFGVSSRSHRHLDSAFEWSARTALAKSSKELAGSRNSLSISQRPATCIGA